MAANRWTGWLFIAIIILCSVALSGWSAWKNEAAALPVSDIEGLEQLADGVLAEEDRLWVVTAYTSSGVLRWSGKQAEDAVQWAVRQAEAAPRNEEIAWYVNVQGTLTDGMRAEDVWTFIESRMGTAAAESYAEETTYSNSYNTEQFSQAVAYIQQEINLQAAAHLDTETKKWRVTLGTPAILIEF